MMSNQGNTAFVHFVQCSESKSFLAVESTKPTSMQLVSIKHFICVFKNCSGKSCGHCVLLLIPYISLLTWPSDTLSFFLVLSRNPVHI